MKILVNYSDNNFKKQQKLNSKTGLKIGGFDKVIEYGPEILGVDFYNKHSSFIETNKRGGGYWIWKPYIILNTLLFDAAEGDYIFYCDSGTTFVNSIDYLINDLEKSEQDILLTEIPLLEFQWTKSECFVQLECLQDKYLYSNQVQAGFILVKKTQNSINFFQDFFDTCSIYSMLDDGYDKELNASLIAHRNDQSVLSLFAKKRNLMFFRDISQYGIRPWQYIAPNREYCIKSYSNSNYPQIVNLYRRGNWRTVLIKEKIKDRLGFKLRLSNEKNYS